MKHRHAIAPLLDPASVLLVLGSDDPAAGPPWAAALRSQYEAIESAAADAATRRNRRGAAVRRRIVSVEGWRAGRYRPDDPAEVTAVCELAVIATAFAEVTDALSIAQAHGVRMAVVIARSPDDAAIASIRAEAHARGIRLLGPGSMGLICPPVRLDASRLGRLPPPGNVALVSQSGALAGAMLDWAADTSIGFSLVLSLGAESDVDLAEVLDYLAGDSRTRAVVVYLDSIRDARGFMSALRALATVKPVVVLKGGRDGAVRGASHTHSGAIAPADAVYSAAFRRAGAVQVGVFTQLFTAVRYLATRNWPSGRRLAIIASGHGPAQLAADQALSKGIALARFDGATLESLRAALPKIVAGNPMDLSIDAGPDAFAAAIDSLAGDSASDAVLAVIAAGSGSDGKAIADRIVARSRDFPKPLFACWLGDSTARSYRAKLDIAGLPVFRSPEAAVDAFHTIANFQENQLLLQQTPHALSELDPPDLARARSIIDDAVGRGRGVLSEIESQALLEAFRIPVAPARLAASVEEAVRFAQQLGFPVVLKIVSADVNGKSDLDAVVLDLRDAQEVRSAFESVTSSVRSALPDARIDGVSVQPMVRGRGVRELYVGVVRNRLFGPVIAFGAGGTRIELLADATLEFPPLNSFLANGMIDRTRVSATLGSFRGLPAVDREALVRILLRVSEMVCELPRLLEMDINPLIADGAGAIAVDARIVLDTGPVRPGIRHGHMAIMPYPAYLSRELVLRDGRSCRMRAIRAEDADRLQRFLRALSPQSRYFRFISTLDQLSPRMLVRYTQIDYDRELALVAVQPAGPGEAIDGDTERIVGVARYLLNRDRETCEFAIAIDDSCQGQGLGTGMMLALIDEAKARGLSWIEGYVLAINLPMLRLMRALGFSVETDPEDETIRWVRLPLTTRE
jgi:acetyltransferase